jgi:hypothetical protein
VTPFLTEAEVGELDELYLLAFHAVEDVRKRAPVGRALHAVKVPPRLSEGIVAAHCHEIFGPPTRVLPRCAPHDITLQTRRRVNVAVKGSGLTDWAAITPADRLADVLVWVDYHDRILDRAAPVIVWRIPVTRLAQASYRSFLRSLCRGRSGVPIWPGCH